MRKVLDRDPAERVLIELGEADYPESCFGRVQQP
jgi:hypothetical protein